LDVIAATRMPRSGRVDIHQWSPARARL